MSVYLFAGQVHYPGGGVHDYQGCFETVEAAKQAFTTFQRENEVRWPLWAHIANDSMEIIESYEDGDRRLEESEWEIEGGVYLV